MKQLSALQLLTAAVCSSALIQTSYGLKLENLEPAGRVQAREDVFFMPRIVSCKTASYFDCGYIIGQATRDLIDDVIQNDAFLKSLFDYADSDAGRSVLGAIHDINRNKYPHLMEEVQGIALGSRQPFWKLLALNFLQELFQFMHQDFTQSMQNRTFLLRAQIGTAPAFTAYNYPGCLSGWSWGINEYGLALSVNTLTPYIQVGLASGFVARDVLEARSLDDAIGRVSVAGQGSGLSANMGIVTDPHRQVNVETSFDQSTVLNIRLGTSYAHANQYLHTVIASPPQASSDHRVARIKAMGPGKTVEDIRRALGDTVDKEWPIYNNGTISTVIFDMMSRTVTLWTANPKSADPVWKTTWRDEFDTVFVDER